MERREEGDVSEITAQMLLSPRVSCAAVMLHTHSCTSSDATAFTRHYSRYAFKHEIRSILRTCTPDSALVQTSCTARLLSTVLQRRAAQPRNQATSPTRVLFTSNPAKNSPHHAGKAQGKRSRLVHVQRRQRLAGWSGSSGAVAPHPVTGCRSSGLFWAIFFFC